MAGTTGNTGTFEAETIIRVVEVKDTRQYIEQGDRWVPVPGSGDIRQCARCGRDHEVHATVLLESGALAVVGTGCMSGASMDFERAVKAGTSTAKTLARNRAALDAARAELERRQAISAEVEALTIPEVEECTAEVEFGREKGKIVPAARCGEILSYDRDSRSTEFELAENARWRWRRARYIERAGNDEPIYLQEDRVEHLEKQIVRAEKRLADAGIRPIGQE